ncbi:MAG TPA: hypothetical protein VHF01_18590 [Candidatus Acidoferrum sp.]|nr:hypothetical protein [Candidatus Acidoferrum sp.]
MTFLLEHPPHPLDICAVLPFAVGSDWRLRSLVEARISAFFPKAQGKRRRHSGKRRNPDA